MKKCCNIVLLMANMCFGTTFLWSVIRFFMHIAGATEGDSIVAYYFNNQLLPALSMLLLMALPVWLLVRNLKNKSGKALTILTIVLHAVFLVISVLPAMPHRYLLWSALGLMDTTLGLVLMVLCSESALLLAGYALSVTGSVLSLLDGKKKVEETL